MEDIIETLVTDVFVPIITMLTIIFGIAVLLTIILVLFGIFFVKKGHATQCKWKIVLGGVMLCIAGIILLMVMSVVLHAVCTI